MPGMPLRKYIKIDLSILDNTSWAGPAGSVQLALATIYIIQEHRRNNQAACGQLRMDVDTNHRNQDEGAPYCVHNVLPVHCTQLCVGYRKD